MNPESDAPTQTEIMQRMADALLAIRNQARRVNEGQDNAYSQVGTIALWNCKLALDAFNKWKSKPKFSDVESLRAQLALSQRTLHECYALTGHEAGDADDFRALVDREKHVVAAVKEMREECATAQADTTRLDRLEQGGWVQLWSDGWSAARFNKDRRLCWGKSRGHPTARAAMDAVWEEEVP